MKIFIDENIPTITVQALRDLDHDVLDIRSTLAEGMEDEILWQKIQNEKRLIITTDKGFSKNRNDPHYGILIIRLKQPNLNKIHQRIMQAINQFGEKEWKGLLVVMRDVVQSTWKRSKS